MTRSCHGSVHWIVTGPPSPFRATVPTSWTCPCERVESSNRPRAAYRRWLERLFEVRPNIQFEYDDFVAEGPHWDTRVGVERRDRGSGSKGQARPNENQMRPAGGPA